MQKYPFFFGVAKKNESQGLWKEKIVKYCHLIFLGRISMFLFVLHSLFCIFAYEYNCLIDITNIKEVFASTWCTSEIANFKKVHVNIRMQMLTLSGVGFAVVCVQVFGDTLR